VRDREETMMALLRNTSPCLLLLLAAALDIPSGTTLAADAVRGVTDTEIIIGTMTDLSGVTAVQAVNNVNAVRMAFDEANAKGGVHGRLSRGLEWARHPGASPPMSMTGSWFKVQQDLSCGW
jgi:hypothetical protein